MLNLNKILSLSLHLSRVWRPLPAEERLHNHFLTQKTITTSPGSWHHSQPSTPLNKSQSVSQSVSDKHSQWSDSGPITRPSQFGILNPICLPFIQKLAKMIWNYQKLNEGARNLKKVPGMTKNYLKLPESTRKQQSLPESIGKYHKCQEKTRIYKKTRKSTRNYQKVPESKKGPKNARHYQKYHKVLKGTQKYHKVLYSAI